MFIGCSLIYFSFISILLYEDDYWSLCYFKAQLFFGCENLRCWLFVGSNWESLKIPHVNIVVLLLTSRRKPLDGCQVMPFTFQRRYYFFVILDLQLEFWMPKFYLWKKILHFSKYKLFHWILFMLFEYVTAE